MPENTYPSVPVVPSFQVNRNMKLECVTVCVNFSDVLAFTLPANKAHFDRMIVVSDTKDAATKNLCSHHHVELVQTDEFYSDDVAFAKARGINVGLKHLDPSDWVLHLDADIVLPPRTREMLEVIKPDSLSIHGIDRMMCPDFESWIKYTQAPTQHYTAETFVIPEPFPMGARVAPRNHDGYLPIGFFQLWNAGVTGIRDYPQEHGTAGRTDMLHALRWRRQLRSMIPELVGIHLQGKLPEGMTNWRGRQMEKFGYA